ncbi:MAG: response regulator transcription factor [Gammaproteobacteria bacterium]|nr:response regulator transcription factor [Gammaproteobacteria bacterium]MDH5653096.1 response regulator transcription factor [Gammaproteobacteria bacterium]
MINIVIVSDIRLYREGLSEILNHEESFRVIGQACGAEQAISCIKETSPHIVVIDMTIAGCCNVVGKIVSSFPQVKVIALAVPDDEETILACAQSGIVGYVVRDASIKQLINTIHGVNDGEFYCPRHIAASLIQLHKNKTSDFPYDELDQNSQVNAVLEQLTRREREIANLIFDGLSNKQIANNLTIEVSTVKNHIHNILAKMGIHSRGQMATVLRREYQQLK